MGSKLSIYSDVIAEKSGTERVWIGVAIIPIITTLPEISSGISAALINAPNLSFKKKNKENNGIIEESYKDISLSKTYIKFLIASLIIIISAWEMINSSKSLAHITRLGTTFWGTFFLAIVTSLPELVCVITAVKIKAYDLAIGIVFGANIINITIPFFSDVFYFGHPILNDISNYHLISIFTVIILSGVVIVNILYQSKHVLLKKMISSVFIVSLYFVSILIIYNLH